MVPSREEQVGREGAPGGRGNATPGSAHRPPAPMLPTHPGQDLQYINGSAHWGLKGRSELAATYYDSGHWVYDSAYRVPAN